MVSTESAHLASSRWLAAVGRATDAGAIGVPALPALDGAPPEDVLLAADADPADVEDDAL
ncbi:MAG TPA: hypothetical protein VGE27_05015 [Gemmatimonas sp.]